MFIKPAPGLKIPDPDLNDFLPELGREVPDGPYWRRRINDQDVALATPAAEEPVIADDRSAKDDSSI